MHSAHSIQRDRIVLLHIQNDNIIVPRTDRRVTGARVRRLVTVGYSLRKGGSEQGARGIRSI